MRFVMNSIKRIFLKRNQNFFYIILKIDSSSKNIDSPKKDPGDNFLNGKPFGL